VGASWLAGGAARSRASLPQVPGRVSPYSPLLTAQRGLPGGDPGGNTPASATSRRVPGSTPGPRSSPNLLGSLIHPGQDAQQQDAEFGSVTPSPAYARDHTIFASGTLGAGCNRPAGCPVLFRTTDAGQSWKPLPAGGFAGGKILLPPTYPSDPTIYASTPLGLQLSTDQGGTFQLTVPNPAPDSIATNANGAETIVAIGSNPMWIYHSSTGSITPGPAEPAGLTLPDDIAIGRDGSIIATTTQVDLRAPQAVDGVVLTCGSLVCRETLVATATAPLHLEVAPLSGEVVAWAPTRLYTSDDGGKSFIQRLIPDADGSLGSVTPSLQSAHSLVFGFNAPPEHGGPSVLVSAEGSPYLGARSGPPDAANLSFAQQMPDGRLIVTLEAPLVQIFGIRCSSDGGLTWSLGC
ncbi:MAG: beta propeller repeat protein, partial [Candidatus Dormibacteria bacterium]